MTYKNLVQQFTHDGYMKKLAGNIKTKLSELRQSANPGDERRWIWELIQNGKDVHIPGIPFKVSIKLSDFGEKGHLEFKHTGKPFSVKNITYLVEQVSSKDQEDYEDGTPPTGKFGSGFLTTHLLSETVKIESVIKADGLEYKRCQIELDRSPRAEAGIIESIRRSLNILEDLDNIETITSYRPQDYNTAFIYDLDKKGIDVAKTGIEDLELSIPLTLIFVPTIKEVTIENSSKIYRIKPELSYSIENITYHTIEEIGPDGTELIEFLSVSGNNTHIAVPIKKSNGIVAISPIDKNRQPKLFCDFPLIGTEGFPFPVIINSPQFNVNDPRSIVRLTDNSEPEIQENKSLIVEAVTLLQKLLEYCSKNGVENLFYLADAAEASQNWISKEWYKTNVITPLLKTLSSLPLVDTEMLERRSIQNEEGRSTITFPSDSMEEVRDMIFEIGSSVYPSHMPRKSEIHEWYRVLWPKCYRLTVKRLAAIIHDSENIEVLQEKILDLDAIEWLQNFYDLLNKEANYISEVVSNNIAVIPNQNRVFKLMKELKFDPGIEDVYKDILIELDYDIRNELRITNVYTAAKDPEAKYKIQHSTFKKENLPKLINSRLKEVDGDKSFIAAFSMSCVFPRSGEYPACREKIFDALQRIYPLLGAEKLYVDEYWEEVYTESDQIIFNSIISLISKCKNIKGFKEEYKFFNEEEALRWLVDFVTMSIEMGKEESILGIKNPILPNQNGQFCSKESLFSGVNTNERLKDISAFLGYDYRDLLIADLMPLKFEQSRYIDDKLVAEKISMLIGGLMADLEQDEDTINAFKKLFIWFNENPSLASSIFGDLYLNRHRLCQPEQIVSSMEKAATLDSLLSEYELDSPEQLREILKNKRDRNSHDGVFEPLTQDILLSLGVKNFEELKDALMDKNLAEVFGHTSIPDPEYFIFVQAKIDRTHDRVRLFLEELGYNFENADRTATTVFSGVIKEGRLIDIVFRPGDNGQVIFYYGSETSTLKNPNAELWVDSGLNEPFQLTLGRILEDNDIKKIIFR
ncbi:sacsin N-terminal ATP-binding-like domain-containing protein [Chitinophaga sp. Hz27]|uniref:sacsin N-terminal ATP-binding-like domain-containing protein n=1 Tax=Chitinophaga sp. Hz27 TaxID=3347169 RepID=UPI0035D92E77